jgi:hypothetical protein
VALSRHTRGLIGVGIFIVGVGVVGKFTPEEWRRGPEPPKAPATPVHEQYVVGPGLLRPGYVMCRRESALSEARTLIRSGRSEMISDIGCIGTSANHDAVLTDFGAWTSEVRVRVSNGVSIGFFVTTDALVKQPQYQ